MSRNPVNNFVPGSLLTIEEPCDLYVDLYQYYVGEGTNYPTASSITIPDNAIIYVEGDFVIDIDVAYKGVKFEIAPDKEIFVQWNVTLRLDECILFSCVGKWNGIRAQSAAKIFMQSSELYRATRGISYDNPLIGGVLSLKNNYFQDNEVSVYLGAATNALIPVSVIEFHNNYFVGGIQYPSNSAIYVENMPLILPFNESGKNTIINVATGIFARKCSIVDINNIDMSHINKGIDYDMGIVGTFDCKFTNAKSAGIDIGRCQDANIDFCLFDWDKELITDINPATHYGLRINELAPSCHLQIIKSTFNANLDGLNIDIARLQYITGVFINGNNAGNDVKIDIVKTESPNKFTINAMNSRGINLSGSFPKSTKINIISNEFSMGGVYGPPNLSTYGILCNNGTKHNLNIKENVFTPIHVPNDFVYGIELSGAVTLPTPTNYIILNKFITHQRHGIRLTNFRNAMVCSNTFFDGGVGIMCIGMDNGTRLQKNKTYYPRLIDINSSGVIGNQFIVNPDQTVRTYGNEWHYTYSTLLGGYTYVDPQVRNQNSSAPFASRFIVHTPRSGNPNLPGTTFYPFHPYKISPDPNLVPWFTYVPFSMVISDCYKGDITLQENDEEVANGAFADSLDAATLWEWERYLYDNLAEHADWIDLKAAYGSFMSAKASGMLAALYSLGRSIEQAHSQQADLSNNIATTNTAIQGASSQLRQMLAHEGEDSLTLKNIQQKQKELQVLFLEADRLLKSYDARVRQAYQNALSMPLQSMHPSEAHLFTTYRAYLSRYLHTDRSIPQDTIDLLLTIAALCPRTAGPGVYMARALLADLYPQVSYNDEQEDCLPEGSDLGEEVESRGQENTSAKSFLIIPNPASEAFSVQLSDVSAGSVFILNSLGQVIRQQSFTAGSSQMAIEGTYAPGLYRVVVQYSNGLHESANLSIIK